jgi:hypothetical protein
VAITQNGWSLSGGSKSKPYTSQLHPTRITISSVASKLHGDPFVGVFGLVVAIILGMGVMIWQYQRIHNDILSLKAAIIDSQADRAEIHREVAEVKDQQ